MKETALSFKNLNEMLEESVRDVPDAAAFFYKGQTVTYRALAERIERCAAGLAKLGIKKGDTFGLVLRNCPEFVTLFFGLSRLGAVAVPVNFLERAERLAYIFRDAEVKGCLTSKEFVATVREAQKSVPSFKHLFLKDADDDASFARLLSNDAPPPAASQPDDLVLLIYTAGTTGAPKGVMLTHKNFLANLESCRGAIDLARKDRFLCLLPMFHSFAWTANVLLPLRLGASTVVMETLLPFEPVLKAIWEHKVTLFCGVPPLFAALTQKVKGVKALVLRFLNPVRVAVSGAAALPGPVHQAFEKTFRIPLLEGYGLTEAAPVVSLNPLRGERKDGTVGLPIPGVQVKIVDDEEKPVPVGEVGEICVKGDNVMPGYYKLPKETQEAFTRDGWLKTGDLGKLDADGYLSIVDRKKDLIIVKGLNVYPQEIEAALMTHPAVNEAAAVGIQDDSGDEIIRAFVALKEGQTAERADLMQICREKLAPYKRPKDIEIRKELPKNALGKILKRDLRKEAAGK
jgi:long-chain acyl-CoA synthetase